MSNHFGDLLGATVFYKHARTNTLLTRTVWSVRTDGYVQLGEFSAGGYTEKVAWTGPHEYMLAESLLRVDGHAPGGHCAAAVAAAPSASLFGVSGLAPDGAVAVPALSAPGLPALALPDPSSAPEPSRRSRSPRARRNVYISGLPAWVTAERLKNDFQVKGEVEDVSLWVQGDGQAAYVKYLSAAAAASALNWNNTQYLGMPLRVEYARRG